MDEEQLKKDLVALLLKARNTFIPKPHPILSIKVSYDPSLEVLTLSYWDFKTDKQVIIFDEIVNP